MGIHHSHGYSELGKIGRNKDSIVFRSLEEMKALATTG